jgi:hypothetical protein
MPRILLLLAPALAAAGGQRADSVRLPDPRRGAVKQLKCAALMVPGDAAAEPASDALGE